MGCNTTNSHLSNLGGWYTDVCIPVVVLTVDGVATCTNWVIVFITMQTFTELMLLLAQKE